MGSPSGTAGTTSRSYTDSFIHTDKAARHIGLADPQEAQVTVLAAFLTHTHTHMLTLLPLCATRLFR